ncbi:MAG TPA: hypothetical protein VFZ07_07180 [Dongiaceae bacterium]
MEATSDKNGVLVGPSFHDGYLLGIELMPGKSLRLLCRTVDNLDHHGTVGGLICLRTIDFTEGSTISAVIQKPVKDCSSEEVRNVRRISGPMESQYLRQALDAIRKNDWRFLNVLTSTECRLLALFSGEIDATAV